MRSAPFSGTAKLQSISMATDEPGASGAGRTTRICVSRIVWSSVPPPEITLRMS